MGHGRIASYREKVQHENKGRPRASLRRGRRKRIPLRRLRMSSQRREGGLGREGDCKSEFAWGSPGLGQPGIIINECPLSL